MPEVGNSSPIGKGTPPQGFWLLIMSTPFQLFLLSTGVLEAWSCSKFACHFLLMSISFKLLKKMNAPGGQQACSSAC
jgi:hypothetical protein